MSYLLWKYFHDDEIERFRKLLAHGHHHPQYNTPKSHGGGPAFGLGLAGSPSGAYSTSPRVVKNNRKVSGQGGNAGKGASQPLGRSDINSRDYAGITLLGRIASSQSEGAIEFGLALIEHPAIDLYAQDAENGWTALHRALYFGNITLARAIIEKDCQNPSGLESSAQRGPLSVIKVKDHEGNSPFDVYNATIAKQSLQRGSSSADSDDDSQDEEGSEDLESGEERHANAPLDGDEVFAWGSSNNYNLGLGDNDDRSYPERITLKRPDHLLFRFFREHLELIQDTHDALYNRLASANPRSVSDLPTLIINGPIVIRDVALSKMHSAILTDDPESNLFMCGFGQGGRLGTGDEITRFSYVCVEEGFAGKKILQVALGNSHSLAIDSSGNIFSWGQNSNGVLGYSLPRPTLKDEDPINVTPRQIFGPLKKEVIIGVAASAIHSVAHTSSSLYTWGRNDGQLGLMDSDSRSLEVQAVPRRVAASLFKASIAMVSAINRATVVLLENHSVCVFANYGYKFLKFPPNEVFNNYGIQANTLTTRYDSLADNITSITAAGDTIAAYSTESLFTVNVGAVDANSTTSTTNPSKIRDSLPDPQRVWSLRKGHWDGIKSASVTEDGSVIVCTQAGAVWRRVKRTNVKNAFAGTETFHRKDFKFQRVPGLANVAAVRSTAFGVYAAVRKDCDVTKTQISVNDPSLWEDLEPLLSLRDLEASEPSNDDDTVSPRFWAPVLPRDLLEPLKRTILTSENLEVDASRLLNGRSDGYDIDICTTTSEVLIPVHGFMLGRSSIIRSALSAFRSNGQASIPEVFAIESTMTGERARIAFHGLDFISIVILAIYLYSDTVVDVWNYTRHLPKMAFRYRQIRIELMKTAAHLKLSKLESAVRLMTIPERRLDQDLGLAFDDPRFFEDADTIIELEEAEMTAHSSLLCRRCPFFDGLFNGRAGGQWLAGRRENTSIVRVDLKHVDPKTFRLVLRYIYTDAGTELFDDTVSDDVDEFSDLVMDVMATANELMLDRLSQICQEVLGRFVNVRNVCYLLNSVAPCSVAEFKDSALEYICLQLESLLENHWLNELDEELLEELDGVVRKNQLACLKYAKSGNFELMLHERNLDLAVDIEEERQRRIRDMAFRVNLKNDDSRLSSSFRMARIGSLDDSVVGSPSQEKKQRKAKANRNEPFSPIIRPKDSTQDLMFDMEDDDLLPSALPKVPTPTEADNVDNHDGAWEGRELRSLAEKDQLSFDQQASPNFGDKVNQQSPSPAATKSWSSPALPSSKLGLKEIMAQASSTRTSNLSMSLSVQKAREDSIKKESPKNLSQKERKKQLQRAQQEAISQPQINVEKVDDKPSSPWQVAAKGPKTSLKDVLSGEPTSSPVAPSPKSLASPIPSRPIRRTASPDTRFSGQQRTVSSSTLTKHSPVPSSSSQSYKQPVEKSRPLVPHSKSYKTSTSQPEPALQLSMSDIIGQQRREQEVIKEAVAKRSLQEIQEEQAFQEWWDQESRRAQEQEAVRAAKPTSSGTSRGGKNGGGRGKEGRGRGKDGAGGGRGGKRGGLNGNPGQGQGQGGGRGREKGEGAGAGAGARASHI